MWFKYFDKTDWNLRMWRSYNLKFDANTHGVTQNHYLARASSLLMKLFRTESVWRTILGAVTLSGILIYKDMTAESNKKKAEQAKIDFEMNAEKDREEYRKLLPLNRYNKPTYVLRGMENMMVYLKYPTAITDALEYGANKKAEYLQQDHEKGLDSWLPDSERRLIEFASGKEEEGHH